MLKGQRADEWILSRLGRTIADVTAQLDDFKYNEPLNAIYRFFWNDLCDWYLEWAKPRMQDDEQKGVAQNVMAFALDQTLRLLHPFIPFITEGIFQNLNSVAPTRKLEGLTDAPSSDALIAAQWPEAVEAFIDETAEQQISVVQNVIRAIRDIRNKYNITPSKKLKASAAAPATTAEVLATNASLIEYLGGIEQFATGADIEKAKDAAAAIVDDIELYVHGVIDADAERKRLEKQKQQIENGIKPLQGKLANENFVTRAKPEVVEQSRRRFKELTEQLEAVDKLLAELGD